MDSKRVFCSVLLLFILHGQIFVAAEGRPISIVKQDGFLKEMQLLGLMCRCCDGNGSTECRSSWDSTCPKLDCRPWKFS
ncbi:hypothetical protein HPP92_019374 [Vanilla planifolia]|uniref:Uncharacterized protein n=1 Tax=Vanilla planifolia TaxID=51239 RepID=A0A835Q6P4_VANPL|nr:hypothetical protein HPP92_019858 [Vanilla planifolia]KAG0465210.1 hypothetical protein HPP92_019374 [Vanilla planifolia]